MNGSTPRAHWFVTVDLLIFYIFLTEFKDFSRRLLKFITLGARQEPIALAPVLDVHGTRWMGTNVNASFFKF